MNPAFIDAWRQQIDWCDRGGSPVTARVLEAALGDWLDGGTLRELIPDWRGDPWSDAVALRVAGALHSLVLDGSDAELAAQYPPLADALDPVAGPAVVRGALVVHRERIAEYLQRPPLLPQIAVASWQCCDAAPIDLGAPHAATRLASYVWPDQVERLARLQGAIALAKSLQVQVERADAVAYLERELTAPRLGQTTVVYHSIVWQYLSASMQAAIRALLDAARERATPAAPLVWLALEPPDPKARSQLVLTTWPGGARVILATAQPHGRFVHWGATEPVFTTS